MVPTQEYISGHVYMREQTYFLKTNLRACLDTVESHRKPYIVGDFLSFYRPTYLTCLVTLQNILQYLDFFNKVKDFPL